MPPDPAEPFHAAIRAAPADDLPRLVFADWLDDHGQPERAEYIRLTCAVARGADAGRVMTTRAEDLFRRHREEWFGPLLQVFRQTRLDRGFVTSVAGSPPLLDRHARDLDRFAPCLSHLGVAGTGADVELVLGLGVVRRVTHLLLDRVAPASLDSLAAHVELPNLAELFVQTTGLDRLTEGVRFADWRLVRGVRALRLSIGFGGIDAGDPDRVLTDATREFVDRHLDLPNLRAFRLWGVVEPVAEALARWVRRTRLDELNLHNCCVAGEALSPLLPAIRGTGIEVLRLGQNLLSNTAARLIADTPPPPTLRELRLDRNRIGDRGADALIASPHLRDDLTLHVGNNTFSGRAAARLRERFPSVRF